jgi:hypothetical protein
MCNRSRARSPRCRRLNRANNLSDHLSLIIPATTNSFMSCICERFDCDEVAIWQVFGPYEEQSGQRISSICLRIDWARQTQPLKGFRVFQIVSYDGQTQLRLPEIDLQNYVNSITTVGFYLVNLSQVSKLLMKPLKLERIGNCIFFLARYSLL